MGDLLSFAIETAQAYGECAAKHRALAEWLEPPMVDNTNVTWEPVQQVTIKRMRINRLSMRCVSS